MKKYVRKPTQNKEDSSFGHNRRGFQKHKPRQFGPPANATPYERSVWLLNSFRGRSVRLRDNESGEHLVRRFKKVVEQSGIMRDLKKKEFHLTKTQKKKEKQKKAVKRMRKLEKRMGFFEEDDLKPMMNPSLFSDIFGS